MRARPGPTLASILGATLLFAVIGCGDDDGPLVPIREQTSADDAPVRDVDRELPVSRELQGQPIVHVEGAPVELAGGALHALLTQDLDGDEDRDAMVLGVNPEGEVVLGLGRRQGNAFRNQELASLLPRKAVGELATVCVVERAEIRFLSSSWAHAEAALQCGEPGDLADSGGPPQDPVPVSAHFFIEVGAGTPRVKERFLVARGLALTPELGDLDEDGHPDFTLHLTGPDGLTVDLPLKDRAAGLILDPAPALEMLSGRLEEAEGAIANDPTGAAEQADRLVAWNRLLCRGFDPATPEAFHVGDQGGLRCPTAERAGRLDLVARLRAGDFVGAVELLDRMAPSARSAALASEAATAALATVRESGLTTTELARRGDGDLVFRDDATLALLDEPPVRFALPGGARTPDPGVPAILDPSGQYSARLSRRCAGLELEIVDGFSPGPAQTRYQVVDLPAPAPCEGTPEDASHPWRILGWAPQGLVLGAPGRRRVAGVVAGPRVESAEDLGLTTPPPAPLRGPRITPSGTVWILETPLGVMRYEGARMKLWWPEDWPLGERAEAVAISPDGTRIAIRRADGRTAVLEAASGDDPPAAE
ncbi:MAG: hypothetical protein JJ863_13315 [Deltaproteobacteria bacterium]|nr:hypothetical protein [Deltaproteobacteria bacterium]